MVSLRKHVVLKHGSVSVTLWLDFGTRSWMHPINILTWFLLLFGITVVTSKSHEEARDRHKHVVDPTRKLSCKKTVLWTHEISYSVAETRYVTRTLATRGRSKRHTFAINNMTFESMGITQAGIIRNTKTYSTRISTPCCSQCTTEWRCQQEASVFSKLTSSPLQISTESDHSLSDNSRQTPLWYGCLPLQTHVENGRNS